MHRHRRRDIRDPIAMAGETARSTAATGDGTTMDTLAFQQALDRDFRRLIRPH